MTNLFYADSQSSVRYSSKYIENNICSIKLETKVVRLLEDFFLAFLVIKYLSMTFDYYL